MHVVLLSGGSGKRLWPLSNELRSKQYVKCIREEKGNSICSMVQRVWKQIDAAHLGEKSIITASTGQVEIIRSQLGNVNIAVEPERRDTFPAVVLSCAYIKDVLGAEDDERVCFIPVDPYTDNTYFETLKHLEKISVSENADVVLMGVIPNEVSTKYGYIITKFCGKGYYYEVEKFKEKPTIYEAESLVRNNALWNCGVFCVSIKKILSIASDFLQDVTYRNLYSNYSLLPNISFDYQVVEKAEKVFVVPFNGCWKDLGTWNSLSEQMETDGLGNCILEDNENTNVINVRKRDMKAVMEDGHYKVLAYEQLKRLKKNPYTIRCSRAEDAVKTAENLVAAQPDLDFVRLNLCVAGHIFNHRNHLGRDVLQ